MSSTASERGVSPTAMYRSGRPQDAPDSRIVDPQRECVCASFFDRWSRGSRRAAPARGNTRADRFSTAYKASCGRAAGAANADLGTSDDATGSNEPAACNCPGDTAHNRSHEHANQSR